MGPGVCRRCKSQRTQRARVTFKKEVAECGRRSDAVSDRDGAVGLESRRDGTEGLQAASERVIVKFSHFCKD